MDLHGQRPIAIVQARMGSTRLPGKVLAMLAGHPVLWHVVDRLKFCRSLHAIAVATTTRPEDDAIEQWCCDHCVRCFRGENDDVLDRYYQAAKFFQADPVIRITADCPVIDPSVVDEVVWEFRCRNYDICGLGGEFPDGLDCEVVAFHALEIAWREACWASEREHVTPFLYKHPERFRVGFLEKFVHLGHHRWTLDEEADLHFLEAIFARLYREDTPFSTDEILNLLAREPELLALNQGISRNQGYQRSLEADRVVFMKG